MSSPPTSHTKQNTEASTKGNSTTSAIKNEESQLCKYSGVTDWKEHVHADLQPLLKNNEDVIFDSWLKVRLVSALMSIPVKITEDGVAVKKIKGVGHYFYPTNGEKKNKAKSSILWIHGGGRIMGSSGGMTSIVVTKMVKVFGVPVLSVQHRLAPRHPFPAALDDAYDAYNWLVEHFQNEEGDDVKISVGGESAGGGLAAELCQRLLDESKSSTSSKTPQPVCQLLIYPMLDDRTCSNDSLTKMPPHLIWNNASNQYAWKSYFGKKHNPGDEEVPQYASAARREDLSNLPPCYILVGDLDLFHDECIKYSNRLKDYAVETELDVVVGGYHAFWSMGKDEQILAEVWERLEIFGKKYM